LPARVLHLQTVGFQEYPEMAAQSELQPTTDQEVKLFEQEYW
jgi:hypothetical protein